MNLQMLRQGKPALVTALFAAVCSQLSLAQVAPSTVLQIDLADVVLYSADIPDPLRYATDPNIPTRGSVRNFYPAIHIGDIVAVNGQQVKGSYTNANTVVGLRLAPDPGFAIADTHRNTIAAVTLEFLRSDGTPIGTIFAQGVSGGTPPPGSPVPPSTVLTGGHNLAITGGTGAFLGVRGQLGSGPPVSRSTSFTEDPVNRRRHRGGNGTWRWIAHLIPMSAPQVVTGDNGPAVFHADFSPVTASRPARAGEVLMIQATGLGPTVPALEPGRPFPLDANLPVNSPLAVKVNGQDAEVVNGVGWPGLVDTYRVDFRVPSGIGAGMASVELSAAWIAGTAVRIAVQ